MASFSFDHHFYQSAWSRHSADQLIIFWLSPGFFQKKVQLNCQHGSSDERRYCEQPCLDCILHRAMFCLVFGPYLRETLPLQTTAKFPTDLEQISLLGGGEGGQGSLGKMVSMIHIMCLAAEGIENISLEHNQGTKFFSISSLIKLDLNIILQGRSQI